MLTAPSLTAEPAKVLKNWPCQSWFRLQLAVCALGFSISAQAAVNLELSWTNNLLSISSPKLPGGKLDILYLEAFCHKGSTHQDWGRTVLRHKTTLVSAEPNHLSFRTLVQPNVEVQHEVRSASDTIDLDFTLNNHGPQAVDLEWFQPACIRVAQFTGRDQTNYISRSFIFTERGLTTLEHTRRSEQAYYRGGQVYIPKGINLGDVNPRPLSQDQPTNGLIGCWSADSKLLLATASDQTQELFEGVFVCLHSDPRVGGLPAGATKHVHARIYIIENDPQKLLQRYGEDFPNSGK